jgi:signal peptidase I
MIKYLQLGLIGILVVALVAVLALGGGETAFTSEERFSPKDRISKDQINVYSNKVVLDIEKPMWAGFADTNSMDPFIDAGANSIEIKPSSASDISEGDVISYYYQEDIVVHRVIMVGEDAEGIFYIVKGDNNSRPDPEKVRFEQVHGVLVAVIY